MRIQSIFVDYEPPTLSTRDIEAFLGEQLSISYELAKEERPSQPTNTMVETRQPKEFIFPIRETNGESKMKNINPYVLLHFNGLTIKDPDTFMFEFVVV